MLILPADADEALVSTAVDRIAKAIEPAGGSVTEIDRWGRRRFAYEIDDQHDGYYVVLRFTGDPSIQPELDRVLNIADEVIRHKILVAPPKPAPKADDAKRASTTAAEPAAAAPTPDPTPAETPSTDEAQRERSDEEAASPAPA
jgi:small subunit ribosomal protein S6